MKKKQFILPLIVLGTSIGLLSGCGSKNDGPFSNVKLSKDENQTLALQASSAIALTGSTQNSRAMRQRLNSTTQAQADVDVAALIPQFDLLLNNGSDFDVKVQSSDREAYDFKQQVAFTNALGQSDNYTLYYNSVDKSEFAYVVPGFGDFNDDFEDLFDDLDEQGIVEFDDLDDLVEKIAKREKEKVKIELKYQGNVASLDLKLELGEIELVEYEEKVAQLKADLDKKVAEIEAEINKYREQLNETLDVFKQEVKGYKDRLRERKAELAEVFEQLKEEWMNTYGADAEAKYYYWMYSFKLKHGEAWEDELDKWAEKRNEYIGTLEEKSAEWKEAHNFNVSEFKYMFDKDLEEGEFTLIRGIAVVDEVEHNFFATTTKETETDDDEVETEEKMYFKLITGENSFVRIVREIETEVEQDESEYEESFTYHVIENGEITYDYRLEIEREIEEGEEEYELVLYVNGQTYKVEAEEKDGEYYLEIKLYGQTKAEHVFKKVETTDPETGEVSVTYEEVTA